MKYRPYALLAELTYRCPLHCPYCSNPTWGTSILDGGEGTVGSGDRARELSTDEWCRVLREAGALGVLQAGLSGGEPLQRSDLGEIVTAARAAGLYTNLITSGIGLSARRARELREAGLDSAQISFQADHADLADAIAGTRAHARKIEAASAVRSAGIALSANVVLHRKNIDRLPQIISFAESLGAQRLELANTQFYGWAFINRQTLIPTREQVFTARAIAVDAKERLRDRMDIYYVLPDYFESRPKPCLNGWGTRYMTVNPQGEVLPCATASSIAGLRFDSVHAHSLAWIWSESESFNRFRGTEWMPAPCRECPQKEIDFGGCRCQAALLTGEAANTDPVCEFSPHRSLVDEAIRSAGSEMPLRFRTNPVV